MVCKINLVPALRPQTRTFDLVPQGTEERTNRMLANIKIGLNPLPWVLTPSGFDLSEPVLRTAFSEIATTPFRAVKTEPPAGMNAAKYRHLLDEYGLQPAPGYFSASFHTEAADDIVEAAIRHAGMQAELGNTEVFIAPRLTPERR
jgi:inosose dehydratase